MCQHYVDINVLLTPYLLRWILLPCPTVILITRPFLHWVPLQCDTPQEQPSHAGGVARGGTPDIPLKASAPAPERQTPVNMSQTSILFVARCLFLVIRARQSDPAAGMSVTPSEENSDGTRCATPGSLDSALIGHKMQNSHF